MIDPQLEYPRLVAQTRRISAVPALDVGPLCPAAGTTDLLGLTHPRGHTSQESII